MPRDGSGTADNATGPPGHDIIHGTGKEPTTDHVARADKTAPLPEPEKGAAIEGLPASGGGDKYAAQGGDLSKSGVERKQ
ncbi:hypothetical protein FKW77_004647 [Venturia effusa]|uniref:Uncharacterized protein n=1 Tax=Venturia effusa TaxID=50376 RepID=A0A517LIL8_9PEZI|nr:hypothetical protein FKW77_004647 [Venturia effusa]